MDAETLWIIQQIIDRGNTAEVKNVKDGVIVLEVTRKIAKRMN